MARFQFPGGSYQSTSVNADCQRTVNLYPEAIESGVGASAMALYPTWGLHQSYVATSGDCITGLFATGNSYLFGATGSHASTTSPSTCEVFWLNDDGLQWSGPIIAMADPAYFAANSANQVMISNSSDFQLLNLATATMAPPTTPPQVNQSTFVSYIDGYFITLLPGPYGFQLSALNNGNVWAAADVYPISEFSEFPTSMLVAQRNVWFWSDQHCVVYADTGDQYNPFQAIPGAFIEQGISAVHSRVCMANSVFWLGGRETGEGVALMAQGWTPKRVSNHAIEAAWGQYTTISDAIGSCWQQDGHFIWQLYFPTADATWRYDAITGLWHEAGAWDSVHDVYHAHRSRCHAYQTGHHHMGDTQSPTVNLMTPYYCDDNGAPIVRMRRAPHISNELEWTFHHKLRLNMETGLATIPPAPLTGTATGITQLAAQDVNGVYWMFNVLDSGSWETASYSFLDLTPYIFVDIALYPYQIVCYTLGVDTSGNPIAIPPAPPPALPIVQGYIKRLPMSTYPSALQTYLSVQDGQLIVEAPMQAIREPAVMLRWSDDGGHSWSNTYTCGAGMMGNFTRRVEWRRLGRTRDRVYEIKVADPIPWRLVDLYLVATPGYQPIERYATQMGKMA